MISVKNLPFSKEKLRELGKLCIKNLSIKEKKKNLEGGLRAFKDGKVYSMGCKNISSST